VQETRTTEGKTWNKFNIVGESLRWEDGALELSAFGANLGEGPLKQRSSGTLPRIKQHQHGTLSWPITW